MRIYLAEKDTLIVKSFNELLCGIPQEEKTKLSKGRAEKYHREYQKNYIEDKDALLNCKVTK